MDHWYGYVGDYKITTSLGKGLTGKVKIAIKNNTSYAIKFFKIKNSIYN